MIISPIEPYVVYQEGPAAGWPFARPETLPAGPGAAAGPAPAARTPSHPLPGAAGGHTHPLGGPPGTPL
ncbi:unnamed protein product [Bubo scandiacus]